MIEVRVGLLIHRPPEEVFAYLSNFENNPRWQRGMIGAKSTSPGELRVGSTYDQVATFLGRRVISTFEVRDYQPGRLVSASSIAGSFPIRFTRIVEPAAGGSRVNALVEGEPQGFFKIVEPLLKRLVERSVVGDYRRLKEILERRS